MPIALVGGGTGLIGDPSGKKDERSLLTPEQVDANVAGIRSQLERFLDFDGANAARMANNADWLTTMPLTDFLRDVGKHFTIGYMTAKESVKSRVESGLSFTEFSYMLLQSYDYLELNRRYGCILQMGGSDQWGNIVSGADLIRRVEAKEAYGLTTPLVTRSDGKKMGKSADGAIWLNEDMMSSYDFWQWWRNVDDADVGKFLKMFTELPVDECDRLGALEGSEINEAKIRLANEITTLAHGPAAAAAAAATAREVFAKGGVGDDLPTLALTKDEIADGISIVQLIVRSGLAKSGKDAKRLIAENGAKLDDAPLTDAGLMIDASMFDNTIILSAGKKRYALLTLT